jgi:predicted phage baseplate assembly protein
MSDPRDTCGCCAAPGGETPADVQDRPGLAAPAYRVGDWAAFRAAMRGRLSATPGLEGLTSRDDGDFSLALLDAFACVVDILTFYQERQAREGWLTSATERLSVTELARLVGYRPRPGAAAETWLAVTLDSAPGAPAEVKLDAGLKVQSTPGPGETPQTFETLESITCRPSWNRLPARQYGPDYLSASRDRLWLEGTDARLAAGDRLLLLANGAPWTVAVVRAAATDARAKRTEVALVAAVGTPPATLTAASFAVSVFRRRAALFGHNAPDPRLLTADQKTALGVSAATGNDWPMQSHQSGTTLTLDAVYPAVQKDAWILVNGVWKRVQTAAEAAVADYTLTGRVTRLTLDSGAGIVSFTAVRGAVVHCEADALTPAAAPGAATLTGREVWIDADAQDLPLPRVLIAEGLAEDGSPAAEVVTVEAVGGGGRKLVLAQPGLKLVYRAEGLAFHANVARAGHGETVSEVLGSGDARRPHQQFALRQGPLTFRLDPSQPAGVKDTLEVRVNGLLWTGRDTLHQAGEARAYTLELAESGARLRFGDGRAGARLPTGQENLTARYRKGLGAAGNLKAGQLNLPLSRPLGLKAAVNPLPAEGGADPEPLEDARRGAPLRVLTLDRVVTLTDYADFARAYAGVGKARADWVWDGARRVIVVTVADSQGDAPPVDGALLAGLLDALRRFGDAHLPVVARPFRARAFLVDARLRTVPVHLEADVHTRAATALREAFDFAVRDFARPVHGAEVIAVLQGVDGVLAVDLNGLVRFPFYSAGHAARLPSRGAECKDGQLLGAELLLLDASTPSFGILS